MNPGDMVAGDEGTGTSFYDARLGSADGMDPGRGVPVSAGFSAGNAHSASRRQPAVSVIVVVENLEDEDSDLKETLAAALSQTFRDFEILCMSEDGEDGGARVLDGRSDGSRGAGDGGAGVGAGGGGERGLGPAASASLLAAASSGDSRLRFADSGGKGFAVAVNAGIREARGRYVMVLEPGDVLDSRALERLVGVADSTDADVVKGDCIAVSAVAGSDSGRAAYGAARGVAGIIPVEMTGHVFNGWAEPQLFLCNTTMRTAICKRSLLLGNGLRMLEGTDDEFRGFSLVFEVRVLAQRVVFVPYGVTRLRDDAPGSQLMSGSHRKILGVCEEFDAIEDFVDAVSPRAQLRPYVFRMRYDAYMQRFDGLPEPARSRFGKAMSGDFASGINRGDYVPSLFAPHQQKNLQLVVEDLQRFLRLYPEKPDRSSLSRYYLRIGGRSAMKSFQNG